MGTFLVNAKMHPELAARVEAAVTGQRPSRSSSRLAATLRGGARVAFVLAVIAVVLLVLHKRREDQRALAHERGELLDRVAHESANLTEVDRKALARDEALLAGWSGAWPGESTADGVRGPGGLRIALARPTVWVRGPIDGFTPAKIAKTEADSLKDALLYCLIAPPTAKTEKVLLARVKTAYASGEMEKRTPNVQRLGDAVLGLRFLAPTWTAHVADATSVETVSAYRADFDQVSFDRMRGALRAEVLVAVMDEAGTSSGPTEMDGERPHPLRLIVWDLVADAPLLRRRAAVDPAAYSANARAEYASALDGCAFAYDVTEDLTRPSN
jgi:hypothetical protein